MPQPPYAVVTPNPGNLGTGIVGTPIALMFTVRGVWPPPNVGNIVISSITSSNPAFVISGIVLPFTLKTGGPRSTTFIVTATSGAPGTISGTLSCDAALSDVPLSATFVPVGTGITFNPSALIFPLDVLGAVDTVGIDFHNNAGGNTSVTGFTFGDPSISLDPSVTLPFTVNAGATRVGVLFNGNHSILGVVSSTTIVHTDAGDFTLPTSIATDAFVETDPLLGALRDIVFAFNTPGVGKDLSDPTNLNSDLDNTLEFNGAIWNSPGNEKVLRRLEVYYENVGVCTGLKLTLKSWRQTLTPPAFDVNTDTITIGDASADLSERSAFFDVEMAGELIIGQLVRLAGTGPTSLIGFIPHFEDKGEKVENV